MALFFQNIVSFPVVIFSILLTLVIIYWLIACMGLFDIHLFDSDGSDAHAVDVSGDDASFRSEGSSTGLLMKLGLNGVPVTFVITFFTLFGWMISYFFVHYFLRFIDTNLIRYALGAAVLVGSIIASTFLTSIAIRPLKTLFKKLNTTVTAKTLIGQTVEIRSATVSTTNGQATYEDGGAGMILQVRAEEGNAFKRGDRAVILSYDPVSHSYQIMSEEEFKGL